jgi:fluoride exporter
MHYVLVFLGGGRGEIGLAAFYVLGSVALSIAGLFAGLALVRHLT